MNKNSFKLITIVKAYLVAPPSKTVVVTIPHELKPKPGTRYTVKSNGNKIVYEPVEEETF